MSSHSPSDAVAAVRELPAGLCPLPARPSLEFERKRAKKLLREIRSRDPGAKLADAHLVIARQYGFASWPKLVAYYTTLDRHERSAAPPPRQTLSTFEQFAELRLGQHRHGSVTAAQSLAAFIPRFYGKTVADVLAATVSIDDARLVVARENRLPSWQALLEYAAPRDEAAAWERPDSPLMMALRAIREADLASLARIVEAQPDLLDTPGPLERGRHPILRSALLHERRTRSAEARQITDWLVSRGADLRETLHRMLLEVFGHDRPGEKEGGSLEYLEFLLDRGADPDWMPPNGISVLEHVILRARSGEAVDAIARRVVPGKAMWIAAGLGDVDSLVRYFDRGGKLTDAARRHRPDFTAVGPRHMPSLPDADDLGIMWEAFFVAALNLRTNVLDALLDRGFPINYAPSGWTLLNFAAGSRDVPLVEYLVKRGAMMDVKRPPAAALDDWFLENDPTNPDTRRIYELCGGQNAERVIRSYEAPLANPPSFAPRLIQALDSAKEEAVRLGQTEVRLDNLFLALLREESAMSLGFLHAAGVDLGALRRAVEHHLTPGEGGKTERGVPFSAEANEALAAAAAEATRKKRQSVTTHHLLLALVQRDSGPVADIIVAAGGSVARLRDLCATIV